MRTKHMDGELVEFPTKDRLELTGFLKKTGPKNRKLIMHTHGMTGNFFKHPLIWKLAQGLKGSGYDLLSINNRGFGTITRYYLRNGKKRTLGTALERFEDCILDIEAAIRAGKELGYKEFVLSGHSTGCQKVAYYQAKRKDKSVKALVILGPGDDYNLTKKNLGKKFRKAVLIAKKMVRAEKGNEITPSWISKYSSQRFLSYADPKNAEAQLFNYSGKLALFSRIKVPVLAVFGSKEPQTDKTPAQMLKALEEKSRSELLVTKEIKGADHPFIGYEKEVVKAVLDFLRLV